MAERRRSRRDDTGEPKRLRAARRLDSTATTPPARVPSEPPTGKPFPVGMRVIDDDELAALEARWPTAGDVDLVRQLEREKAGLEVQVRLEREDADRRVRAVHAWYRQRDDARRTADRNRKKGLAAERRVKRGPPWNDANDDQLFDSIVLPYEVLCQQHITPADACHEIAQRVGKSYAAVRSVLYRMHKKGALWAPYPDGYEE